MNKSQEFVKNTVILFLGRFCTQFASFLLLPIYTRHLISTDYGYIDLLQTYISLVLPILTIRLDSAVFRFLIDERKNENGKKRVISSSFALWFFEVIVFLVICIVVLPYFKFKYIDLVILNLLAVMLSSVALQIVRGLGKNIDYASTSIITASVTLFLNYILIVKYNFGASSILISSTCANAICSLYIMFKDKIFSYISLKSVDQSLMKEMIKYAAPMVPNALSWWVVSASDRTIISWAINTAANGIYSVSCRFSNILNSIFSIVNMSWQETASLHIGDEDKDDFFSRMISDIWVFFISVSILIVGYMPFLFGILIGREYLQAYNYIPITLFANIWNVVIGLVGGIYVASRKTKEIASTTIVSALINLLINITLIRFIGLYAACISTVVAYMLMAIYRIVDCQKYVRLKFEYSRVVLAMALYFINCIAYYITLPIINIVNTICSTMFVILLNVRYLKLLMKMRRHADEK